MVETLQQEIASFRIRSIIFEAGHFRTQVFSQINAKAYPCRIEDYAPIAEGIEEYIASTNKNQPGDPRKLAERVVDVVKSEGIAAGKPLPPRLPVGRGALIQIKAKCEATLKLCGEWEEWITSTDLTPDP